MEGNIYAERLLAEWHTHDKIIIAFDYDDTIRPWKLRSQSQCDEIIEILKEAQEIGAFLVCFTACKEDKYPDIKEYFKSKHLFVNSINENPFELPFGNNKKVYANIFLDDRAGLEEAISILKYAMHIRRKSINHIK